MIAISYVCNCVTNEPNYTCIVLVSEILFVLLGKLNLLSIYSKWIIPLSTNKGFKWTFNVRLYIAAYPKSIRTL